MYHNLILPLFVRLLPSRRGFTRLCAWLIVASLLITPLTASPFRAASAAGPLAGQPAAKAVHAPAVSEDEAIVAALNGFERLEVGEDDFRISYTGGDTQFDASEAGAAYNPTTNEYLVVWVGDDTFFGEDEVFGQRINAATGEEVGVNDFRISDMGADGDPNFDAFQPAVAYNSTDNEYLVVWVGDDLIDNEAEIYGQRINAAGEEVGDNDFRISQAGPPDDPDYDATQPGIAYNSTDNEYLVVWKGDHATNDELEIYGQRLTAAGMEIGTNDFRISDMGTDGTTLYYGERPEVVYNPNANEYLVVWWGDDNTPPLVDNEFEIFGQRLTATGVEIGTNDFRISDMGPNGNTNYAAWYPAVAHNTTTNQYLVVWYGDDVVENEMEVYGQLLDAAGAEIGTNDFRISEMGPPGDTTYAAYTPHVTYHSNANEYLVVWEGADLTYEYEIYGQRLTAAGAETGANDFRISDMGPDGDIDYNAYNSQVVYNSTDHQYLVVWEGEDKGLTLADEEFEIFGQRLEASGSEVGENDFRISDMGGDTQYSVFDPSVVYNSTENEFLVVWAAPLWMTFEYEIMGQRVDAASGALIGENFRISDMGPEGNTTAEAFSPAATYNSTDNQYLVVWAGVEVPLNEQEIFGQRLDAAGGEIGANDFRISDMGPDGSNLYLTYSPGLIYNQVSNEYLVVWSGDDSVDNEFEIYGQRLDAGGGEIGSNDYRLTHMGVDGNTSFWAGQPHLAFNPDDNQYLLVWVGAENLPLEDEIYGRILDSDGAPSGASHFRLSSMGPDGDSMFLAADPSTAYNPVTSEYMVVWNGDDIVDNKYEIYGQRLTAAGVETGTDDFRISVTGGIDDVIFYADFPSISINPFNGEALVAWRASTPTEPYELELFVQRLSPSADPLDGVFQISESGPPGDTNYYIAQTALAYNPQDDLTLAVWTGVDDRIPMINTDLEVFGQLYAVRVDLGLSSSGLPAFVAPEGSVTTTITATNTGPDLAAGLSLTATLPAGVTYVSASGPGWACAQVADLVTCEASTLDVNASAALTLTVMAPATAGSFTIPVAVASGNTDLEPADNNLLLTSQVTPGGLPLYPRYLPMTLRP